MGYPRYPHPGYEYPSPLTPPKRPRRLILLVIGAVFVLALLISVLWWLNP